MNRFFSVLLLVPMLACQSADSSESRASDELRSSILKGTTLVEDLRLRAETCSRTGDEYRMTGVRLVTADGRDITAEAGTLSTSGDEWLLVLSNVRVIQPGGLAEMEQVAMSIPVKRG